MVDAGRNTNKRGKNAKAGKFFVGDNTNKGGKLIPLLYKQHALTHQSTH